jgi:integrase
MRRSLLSALDGVFQYSIAEGARNDNPAQMIRKRIPSVRSESRPAALTLDDARAVLLAVEAVTAHPSTILCHRLIALTGLRVWEASRLRWEYVPELGATEPVLIIPEAAMKGRRRKHIVPLAPQTVHLLRWARRFSFRGEGWIFPAAFCKGACVSASAIEHVLQRARPMSPVRHVTHGWRATFSTVMNETLKGKGDRDIIDLMIHHKPQAVSGNELAYNFAEYMPRRREIACQWADMLLEGMPPLSHVLDAGLVEMPSEREASVIPLQRATGARS